MCPYQFHRESVCSSVWYSIQKLMFPYVLLLAGLFAMYQTVWCHILGYGQASADVTVMFLLLQSRACTTPRPLWLHTITTSEEGAQLSPRAHRDAFLAVCAMLSTQTERRRRKRGTLGAMMFGFPIPKSLWIVMELSWTEHLPALGKWGINSFFCFHRPCSFCFAIKLSLSRSTGLLPFQVSPSFTAGKWARGSTGLSCPLALNHNSELITTAFLENGKRV